MGFYRKCNISKNTTALLEMVEVRLFLIEKSGSADRLTPGVHALSNLLMPRRRIMGQVGISQIIRNAK